MSGAFYGSLAASASVFVAILTALLVNNYVQIKSDRRQTDTELERVQEELEKFENQQENHKETIDELTGEREQRYKNNAKERVSAFIENEVPSQISTPVEKLNVDVLYLLLSDHHNFDSPDEMEESDERYHRQLLEQQYDEIEKAVRKHITSSFAEDYDITGRRSRITGVESESLEELLDEIDTEEVEDEDSSTDTDKIEVSAEGVDEEPEPVELDKFINDFKEEYGIDTLQPETREALEQQYNEYLNRSEIDRLQSSIEGITEHRTSPLFDNVFETPDITAGLSSQEKSRLEEARKDLAYAENQIETLQRRENRLKDELSGLNPEDLNSTLWANVATIVLSVVVPVAAYLDTVTEFTVAELSFINTWWIFTSWLIGLIIVFAAIYWKINNGNQEEGDEEEEEEETPTEPSQS